MPSDDTLPTPETDALRVENTALRKERDEYRKALYAILWQTITPPTPDELAAAEPVGPWFDELVRRLEQSGGE